MDKIEKALKKFSLKEQKQIKAMLLRLRSGEIKGLDVKKLRGREDIFRVRKGDLRIIYRLEGKEVYILKIERRRERTYRF